VSHDNKLGLSFFDEVSYMVQTELKMVWLWSNMARLILVLGFSLGLKSLLLLLSGLWRVLSEELKKGSRLTLVNGLGELIQDWWCLQSHHENSLLSLDSDVLWPFHESGKVSLWLNISTDSEVSWALLEETL